MRDYEFYYTQDGSIGLYSYSDDDVYHSKFGALTEAWEKFILPSGISKKLNNTADIKVLDVCYGIGYNTKALMSYVINTDETLLKRKNIFQRIYYKIKNFIIKIFSAIKKFLKNFIEKISKKIFQPKDNIVSIDNNNNYCLREEILSPSIETISNNNSNSYSDNKNIISHVTIDCLEINEELVKISPLLKTIITPQEIFTRIIPPIFNCFDLYWKIKKFLARFSLLFAPKNRKEIKELLDLKFSNDYDELKREYKIHKFVNYILIDTLMDLYKEDYFNTDLKFLLKERKLKSFFDKSLMKYAHFKQNFRYNLLTQLNLFAYLHNIYYEHLSKRYKKAKFKDAEKLFSINFHVDDARKSIFKLKGDYDFIFMDAFTYSKAPELWSVEFVAELVQRLSPTGMLMTYSNSALVRNTFLENNLYLGKIKDEKTGKFIGTVASKEKSLIEYPLTNFELGLCATRAGIPYHDYNLASEREVILARREQEFKSSDLMTSSQYMRSRSSRNEDDNEE